MKKGHTLVLTYLALFSAAFPATGQEPAASLAVLSDTSQGSSTATETGEPDATGSNGAPLQNETGGNAEKTNQFTNPQARIERGLISLYRQNGVPLYPGIFGPGTASGPAFFFSSLNNIAIALSDFDRVDDTRSLTSNALFSESAQRLGRPLTPEEFRGIIHGQNQFETLERLRIAYGDWPIIDFFYRYRDERNAQITDYYLPDQFNSVRLNEYGTTLSKTLGIAQDMDLYLAGGYSRINREGIIEFLPHANEAIDQYQTEAALSQLFGADKATIDFTYVYQGIHQDIAEAYGRSRQIGAVTLDCFLPHSQPVPSMNPSEPVAPAPNLRAVDLFAGGAYDAEEYGATYTRKTDIYAGTTVQTSWLDITLQPTYFKGAVDFDPTQDNAQYRTNLTFLYHIFDSDRGDTGREFCGLRPAFVNLQIPLRDDIAIDGPREYENYKVGIGLDTKFFAGPFSSKASGQSTSILASVRYDYEYFYHLQKGENLVSMNLSIGF